MARQPTKQDLQRQFLGLDLSQRRAIIRAVNRGRVVDEPKHALLAVGVARRQQRFWRYAWIIGPLLGVVQAVLIDPMAGLVNGALGTVTLGGLAVFWYRRAVRSERLNAELGAQQGGRRRSGAKGGATATRGSDHGTHLPGRAGRKARARAAAEADAAEAADDEPDDGVIAPAAQRPHRPRGNKRRGR